MNIFKIIWPDLPVIKGVTIDLARKTDAEPIARLSRKYLETGLPGWVWNPEKVLDSICHPDSLVLLGCNSETVIAAAIISFSKRSAHLNLLVVAEEFQHMGIGSCLLRFLENSASLYGKRYLNLEVRANSEAALAFYQVLGYRKMKVLPNYYHNGESAIRMSHSLRAQISASPTLPSSF